MADRPLQYAVYKGMSNKWGAAQFDFKPPVLASIVPKVEGEEGIIFLAATSTSGPNQYDWTKKIVFALSVIDQGKILTGLLGKQDVSLVHDPGANSPNKGQVVKTLSFSAPGGWEKGCMLNLSQKKGEDSLKHTVPLSPDEVTVLKSLFGRAIYRSLGW